MNNKAFTPITMVFVVGFFLMVWIFLADWISAVGELAVTTNNLTGLEAFIMMNLNFVIFIGLLLFIIVYSAFGGGAE